MSHLLATTVSFAVIAIPLTGGEKQSVISSHNELKASSLFLAKTVFTFNNSTIHHFNNSLNRIHIDYYSYCFIACNSFKLSDDIKNGLFLLLQVLTFLQLDENVFNEKVFDLRNHRIFRSENTVLKFFAKQESQLACSFIQEPGVFVLQAEADEPVKRRIPEISAFQNLALIHRKVIVLNNIPDDYAWDYKPG